jgi:hypothetical protein
VDAYEKWKANEVDLRKTEKEAQALARRQQRDVIAQQ